MRVGIPVAAVGTALAVMAGPAAADTTSFSYTGAEQTFTVPAGVTSLQISATGAAGGISGANPATGRGATVTGAVTVTAGQVLYVRVGGVGAENAGGFNGGGGASSGFGGGGATDVRTQSGATGAASLNTRLLVAAGGGGEDAMGHSGGDAEQRGGNTGGYPGTQTAGGLGAGNGTSGTLGQGGTGGAQVCPGCGGSGGGGGLYGGGGGDGQFVSSGGGGGSSLVPSGGTEVIAARTTAARVDISWTPPAPPSGGDTSPAGTPDSGTPTGGTPDGGTPGGGTSTAGAAPDTTRPVLGAFKLSPSSFQAANIGPSLIAASVGGVVSYELSEPATVEFSVLRAIPGHRRGRRCLSSGKGRACTRYANVRGSFEQASVAGTNRVRFTGRVGGRALRRGQYRLVAVAVDAAGNRSARATAAFRVR